MDKKVKIEYDIFGDTYKNCPKNYKQFDERYLNKNLVSVICLKEEEIISLLFLSETTDYFLLSK